MITSIPNLIRAWPLVAKRSIAHWRLLLSVIIGVFLASTIMAGTVVYFDALREFALKTSLGRLTDAQADLLVRAERGPTSSVEYAKVFRPMTQQIDSRVEWLLKGRERGGKSATFFLTATGSEETAGDDNSRAYFAFLDGLPERITLLPGGRMPVEEALSAPGGPLVLEAIIPDSAAQTFGVGVGDSLSAVPHWDDAIPYARVVISGVFQRDDPDDPFWRMEDEIFRFATAIGFRTVPFFLSEDVYMDVLGGGFRDMNSAYAWLLDVDVERINASNSRQAAFDIRLMNRRLSTLLFSYWQISALDRTLADFDRRLFFAKLPMFVVLILIAVVILYYVATLSSLLVEQQRGEVALLRSRGAGSTQILGVFVLEGATIALVAALLSPLLAAFVVSLLGYTPAFTALGGVGSLPASISRGAYAMSALGGGLSFIALIVPSVQASRMGVVRHRQQSARPSDQPFYQRYYLDIMLLVVSLFLFRQLTEQGSVVAVQLFGDVAVDQILLAVPALVLAASALVLLRLFPKAISFLSGDSPELLHLTVGGTTLVLVPAIAANALVYGGGQGWILQIVLLPAVAAAYAATALARDPRLKLVGGALQAGLIAALIAAGPTLPMRLVFLPILVGIVPAQLLFHLLRVFSRRAPVGYSVGLWQMARNPTHYARLSLLLILSAGLGIVAASFGGTLERSYFERALYSTGADIRLEGVRINSFGPTRPLAEVYQSITGVGEVAPAFRGFGADLSQFFGPTYTMFAVDGEAFREVGWSRSDFASRPIETLLDSLVSDTLPNGIELPPNTRNLVVTIKSDAPFDSVVVAAGLRDANDRYVAPCLGALDSADWKIMVADRTNRDCGRQFAQRSRLQPSPPLTLVSLSVHERFGGRRLRAGAVSIDDIRVQTTDGRIEIIDSMVDAGAWSVLRAAPESASDSLTASPAALNGGDGSLRFSWSDGGPLVGRGIYYGRPLAPLPVLANREFLTQTERRVGDELPVSVSGHRLRVKIVDLIDYFPTLNTVTEPYLIADLTSLSRYANLETATSELRPNEIWIAEKINGGRSHGLIERLSTNEAFFNGEVYDRAEALDASKADPLVEAGWSALLFIAFAAVLVLSGLGFLVHAYVSFRNREMEFALMRTLGFSLKQLVTLVWLEQALVIAAGMVLGTWMGGRLGAVIMPFLDQDETGRHVLPPFVLEVDWTALVIAYATMTFVFALIIAGVVWFIHKISLQRILRLGEV